MLRRPGRRRDYGSSERVTNDRLQLQLHRTEDEDDVDDGDSVKERWWWRRKTRRHRSQCMPVVTSVANKSIGRCTANIMSLKLHEGRRCRKIVLVVLVAAALVSIIMFTMCKGSATAHPSRNINKDTTIVFPNVVLRSNRKEVPGYSLFLEELLSRYNSTKHSATLEAKKLATNTSANEKRKPKINANNAPDADDGLHNSPRPSCVSPSGWLCHICLQQTTSTMSRIFTYMFGGGSLQGCRKVCPACLERNLCEQQLPQNVTRSENYRPPRVPYTTGTRQQMPLKVHMYYTNDNDDDASARPIPNGLRNPELVRIQNGWRQSRVAVYHYTYDTARAYVRRHYDGYSDHFSNPDNRTQHGSMIQLFESLRGNFLLQKHLFRLLVLYREGGAFVDVDLMLETKLELLLQHDDVQVIAARDFAQPHGLWDGFLASSPGNAFIASALETAVAFLTTASTTITADHKTNDHGVYYHWLCTRFGPEAPLSSILSPSPTNHDMVIGGQFLGAQLSHGLGATSPLQSIPLGYDVASNFYDSMWKQEDANVNVFILLADPSDTGALRISDVDRNLLVASTRMIGLTVTPVVDRH